MDLDKLHRIYFLGIGGIGMSALARYFHRRGAEVSGYDKTSTRLTNQLLGEGIDVHFEDDPDKVMNNPDLVIYTPAVPQDLGEFELIRTKGFPLKKRSEVLGQLSKDKKTIAVAGTHGKTTVSSMIAHILHNSSVGCNAFIGGIMKNYDSNLIVSPDADFMVVEADEFDKSFLQLNPTISMVTSMDADHLDIYGDYESMQNNFRQFVSQTKADGAAVVKKGINLDISENYRPISYSLKEKAAFYAENIRVHDGKYEFDLHTNSNQTVKIRLGVPGLINVENAVAASAVALTAGVGIKELVMTLATFTGIKRRFDHIIQTDDLIYIDDYAHHPEEINGLISSLRHMYPGKKMVGIFQPHLYSRTRHLADGFASSLDQLDEVILLPIYPAREKPIAGVESEMILRLMKNPKSEVSSKKDLIKNLENKDFDILLTIGAGDIDELVEPVANYLRTEKATL